METSTTCLKCHEKHQAENDFLSIPLSIDKGQCDVVRETDFDLNYH